MRTEAEIRDLHRHLDGAKQTAIERGDQTTANATEGLMQLLTWTLGEPSTFEGLILDLERANRLN